MLSLEFGLSERAAVEILNRCGAGFDEPISRENFSKIFMALRFQLSSSKFEEDDIDEYNETRNDHQRRGEYFEVVSSKFIVRKLRRIFNYRLNNDVTYLDAFVIASLTLALIYILFNLNFESTNYFLNEDKLEDSSLGINILTYLFILELACKCFAFGATRYFDDLWNLFDCLCVFLSWLGALRFFSFKASLILSYAKFMRFLKVIPAFRTITGTAAAFSPAVSPSIMAILCLFYSVAIVVVGVLGSIRLSADEYQANDFRDFVAALVTLFSLAIVNDWNLTMEAFVHATGTKLVQIFFITWWAISQLLLFNTVTSLVLDGFEVTMKELNTINQDQHEHTENLRSPQLLRSISSETKLKILRTLSSSDQQVTPFLRGSSFTIGRMFLELFRDIEEPTDIEVDQACWERGLPVGLPPTH